MELSTVHRLPEIYFSKQTYITLPSISGQNDAWEEDETLPDASSSFPAFACVRSRSSCTPSSAEQSDNHDDDDNYDDDDDDDDGEDVDDDGRDKDDDDGDGLNWSRGLYKEAPTEKQPSRLDVPSISLQYATCWSSSS